MENVAIAIEAGRLLIESGYSPMIPHLTHYMDPDDSLGHGIWMEVDLPWVEVAAAVLRLPGESRGADIEVAHAKSLMIPVFHSLQELTYRLPPA